jgi:transposase
MPTDNMTREEVLAIAKEVMADGVISQEESDRTVVALNSALAIMDKQAEREADIHAQYQDKLKEKDAQLLKIIGAFVSSVMIMSIVLFTAAGLSIKSIIGMGGTLAAQFLLGIVIVWLKDRAPAVVAGIKKATEIIKPLLDPRVQAGVEVISKLVEGAKNGNN